MGERNYDAEELTKTLDEFMEHLHDDLPSGPPSELGGEVQSLRVTLSEQEFQRRAEIGKAAVDAGGESESPARRLGDAARRVYDFCGLGSGAEGDASGPAQHARVALGGKWSGVRM